MSLSLNQINRFWILQATTSVSNLAIDFDCSIRSISSHCFISRMQFFFSSVLCIHIFKEKKTYQVRFLIYPRSASKEKGYTVLPLCVCLSVRPSVCMSVRNKYFRRIFLSSYSSNSVFRFAIR